MTDQQEPLNRAMRKAVELGVFPEASFQEQYLLNWGHLKQILDAANNLPDNVIQDELLPIVGHKVYKPKRIRGGKIVEG